MAYAFELAFSGLCIFTTTGNPTNPSQLDVVLVEGGHHGEEHFPFFTCLSRNLVHPIAPGSSFELIPSPDGDLMVRHSLVGEHLSISLPAGFPAKLIPTRGGTGNKPQSPSEHRFLEWVTPIEKVFPGMSSTGGAPLGGLKVTPRTPIVTLKQGEIVADRIATDLINQKVLVWDFIEEGTGTHDPVKSQALAGKVFVKIRVDTGPVTVKAQKAGWELKLKAATVDGLPELTTRASVTSLPNKESASVGYLKHFEHLRPLIPWPSSPGKIRFPKPAGGGVTSSNTFCPPLWRTT